MPPLQLAFARFTSCSGCQLTLLDCEEQLAALEGIGTWCDFPLASSRRDPAVAIDLALVEGSISTPAELTELLALRARSRRLVAVGACALTGGVNALAPAERAEAPGTFPPQPPGRFVSIDWHLPGCPPERRDLLALFGALRHGGWPGSLRAAVCMECRIRENRCLLTVDRHPCLGPITQGGCGARCPSIEVACEGCRGEVAEAQRDELFPLLLECGLTGFDCHERLARFQGGGGG